MKRRAMIFGAVLAVVSLGFWLSRATEPPEPVSRGRTLTDWLDDRENLPPWGLVPSREASRVVHDLGSEALPTLIAWISSSDSWPVLIASRFQRGLNLPFKVQTNEAKRKRAIQGFNTLGPIAKPAFPKLASIALNSSDFGQRHDVISALRFCDVATMRWFAEKSKDPDPTVRLRAIEALAGVLVALDEVVIPAFEAAAKDPDPLVRAEAAMMLPVFQRNLKTYVSYLTSKVPGMHYNGVQAIGSYRTRARAYLPELEAATRDEAPNVRAAAAEAIQQVRGPNPAPIPESSSIKAPSAGAKK